MGRVCVLGHWEDHAPNETAEEGTERCDGMAPADF